jgi:2-methylcitrate dehydratase PrpD
MSSSTPSLLPHATRDLAKFATETRYDEIPSRVIERIKLSFVDGLGVCVCTARRSVDAAGSGSCD